MTGWNCLAFDDEETTDTAYLGDPGRLKPGSRPEPHIQDLGPHIQEPEPPERDSEYSERDPEYSGHFDPPRPDLHVMAAQGRQDAIEALLRQFRPAIVR